MISKIFNAPSGALIPFTTLGFGTAPLGNLYSPVSQVQADAVMEEQWKSGIRYVDTAPLYGLGLAQTRLNRFFRNKKREDFIVSSKVGRLLKACSSQDRSRQELFCQVPNRKEIYDYTYDGVMRSFEASLERLGIDSIDILLVHDLDIWSHGSSQMMQIKFNEFKHSGYKAMLQLRRQGLTKAIGAGINQVQVSIRIVQNFDMDVMLLAGRFSLLEQDPIQKFFPLCEKRGVGVVLGGIYNSGILATGPIQGAKYNYSIAPKAILEKATKIEKICKKHGLALRQAAVQYCLRPKCVVSLIPGAITPQQVQQNLQTIKKETKQQLWQELFSQKLIDWI